MPTAIESILTHLPEFRKVHQCSGGNLRDTWEGLDLGVSYSSFRAVFPAILSTAAKYDAEINGLLKQLDTVRYKLSNQVIQNI